MIKKIVSILYLATLLVMVLCVPMSAIMLICKLCEATPLSWIGCCVPLLIAIASLPILIITKLLLLDVREGK